MKSKINYLLIPLATVITAVSGSFITNWGMSWYKGIRLPVWTPPGSTIGMVWTVIFILATISALIIYNLMPKGKNRRQIMLVFLANAVLNIGWSALFFGWHQIFMAILEAILLALSVLFLIIMAWPRSKAAAVFLMPYLAWVCFATYLTFTVWSLNK